MSYRSPIRLGIIVLTIIGLFAAFLGRPARADAVYFDDSGPEIMRLGNNLYEVAFRKDNGGIAYIIDKTTGGRVSEGSLNRCLWVVVFDYDTAGEYIESCRFRPNDPYSFHYTWYSTTRQLIMHYDPAPTATRSVSATVTVTASTGNWFDLHLTLTNRWGYVPVHVKFPSDLVFIKQNIHEALLPILPGVILEAGFFERGQTSEAEYPGTMFADFLAMTSSSGRFAMYSISAGDKIVPVRLGFYFANCVNSERTCLTHNFSSGVKDNEIWSSPVVRIRVAEQYLDSINAFREDNALGEFASVSEKLGALSEPLARLPLYKADFGLMPFADYVGHLSGVPYPGILHLVAYWPPGFDENYPDFLPPNPILGTTADMVSMMHQVQAMGYLVMPYINPTWWDDQSPTVHDLLPPLMIEDIAVLDSDGNPRYEDYGEHHGFVVSPYPQFVQQRLDDLMHQMKQSIPSDLIHEDQVGGRSSHPDYNPASPSVAGYSQGWLQHTARYRNLLLTCEHGSDRLASTETAFHGSVLLAEKEGKTEIWWGDDNWHLYPMAPFLLRDKVLLYHNAEARTSTKEKGMLSLNLAFGYMLSYDIGFLGTQDPWLGVVGAFQSHVLAPYATEQITGYSDIAADVTRSDFERTSVIRNWSQSNSYAVNDYVLPPEGVLVQTDDNGLTAGIFTTYHGIPLSTGDHYLIEERGLEDIIVRQPLGTDTSIMVRPLAGWNTTQPIEVWAFTNDNQPITRVPADIGSAAITFTYRQMIAARAVAYYRIITAHPAIFLPLIIRME